MSEKTLNRTLMIAAASAASALLIAGCNSSSSSSSGNGGSNGFASLSQPEKEMFVATLAVEMDDFVTGIGEMGDMALGMTDAGGSYQDPRETQLMSLQSQDGQVSTQVWSDICDTGSYSILADSTDHFHAQFNNCRGGFQDNGFSASWGIDGEIEARTLPSDTHAFLTMSRSNNYSAESSVSGDGMNFGIAVKMNGQSSQHYTAWNDFLLSANQEVEFEMSCDGSTMRAQFSFDDLDVSTIPSSQNAAHAQMELSGAFSMSGNMSGMGGSWTMDTIAPIHFSQFGNPYSGELDIVVDGEAFNVVYEQDGAWINNTYYTWDELEAMEDDIDDDWDFECF